ncbi:Calx-beta domain-containing protein [Undibacterium cyanobacteriorum]|uniref:Calx-beta domain-containing protein n=1 Tax=Undibacterium cyanobacteriorum TaxID=3073561 RepID=A0ABY9RFP8_9BURK|nr:Calx-beta domain-containing protein [Undibacterium sp. 20NA77.5]WMW79455.1 Calx-beta domain-containing protein [Undibacterium sp. 20NA77.5]
MVRTPITSDTIDEIDETFTLTATRTAGTTSNASALGTATITDDDAAPTISSVTSDTQTEGTALVHTVTLTNASSSSTSFAYTIGGGTATSGTDYGTPTFSNGVTLVGGNLIVPAGVTSFTITVPSTQDTIDEANETYNVSVGGVSATGTITDDDAAPTISSVTSDTQTEGTALVHTVTLTNASSSSTSFAYTIGGGTATSGTDYGTPTFSNGVTLVGGNLIVPAGVTSFTITVPSTQDTIDEPNETYNVSVGGVSAVGTITDDDAAPTISSVTSDTQTEGTALVHTVTLTNASSSSTSFAYTIGGGTATSGTDYGTPTFSNGVTLVGGNLIVPAGVTSFTITVPSTQDTIDEANETYNVSVGGVSAVGTITDDDAAPTISSVTSDTQTEGTALVHTVTLTNASSSSTSFAYTIGGGTATSGTDYGTPTFSNGVTLVGGNLIVPAGVTSFTITVPTTDDVVSESSENYNVSVGGVSATGTITDNDGAPTISSVTSDTQTEGTALVHTVTLTNASSSSTSFAYTIGGGTATSGTDYGTPTFSNGVTLVGGNLIVPAGVTSFTITVPSTQDTIDEPNETYNVSVGGVSAVGTVTDDDASPTISSVTSDTQTEGTALVHTVTLTNASSSSTSFAYTIGGGTATSGTDYGTPTFSNGVTLVGGNLIVPAGVTSFTITVPSTQDTIDEPNETYNVSVGGVSAVGTITDDDAAPTISSVTSDTQTEGTSLVHTVTLTNASSSSTSFAYTIGGGTATSGTDYGTPTFSNGVTLVGGNLIVPAGVTSFTITVPSTQDTIDEANETYNVSVGGVSAVGTITDDDAAPTISSVTSDTQTEGTALVHTVTLTNASSSSTSFAYTIGGGTATSGTDYGTPTFSNGVTLVGGNLIVPAGVTSFTITVPTTDDVVSESSENYNVSVGGVSATGTITDNDGAPTISSVTSDTQTEGTALVHTVTLTNASSSSTSFAYTIGGGTATSGTDYGTPTFSNGVTLVGGNLIVPAGVTSFTITVPSTQDTIDEANETYNVSVGGVSATGTITDDDAAPTISSVTSDTQTEGTALVHTVTLTNASSSSTSFAYTIGGGTATSGTDYGTPTFSNGVTLVGGNLIVPAGVTSFTITVPSTQDTIDEPNETYNVSVGGVSAVGTITDDDAAPTISSVTSDTQTEGTALVHTVTLTNASSSSTSFAYTIGGGTATSGTDYGTPTFSNGVTLVGGNLIVPAGVTSFTITVPSTQDTIDEANETYNVSVGGVSAVGTITDDDAAPTISSVTSDTQTEGTALVHTVTLTNASSSSTSFAYTIGGGTATSGTDYGTPTFSNGVTLVGGNLIVPAGVTSFTITVPSTQDTIDEANETYNVSVGGVSAVGTITDDDAAPTISSVTSDTQTEGTALVHTVTLTNASSSSTSFAYTIGGGTATSGTDYGTPTFSNGVTLVGGNLIVPAGVTSFTITVPSTQDTIDEANETYNVSVGGVSAVGTITDDDAAPTISSVTSDTQTEGTALVHTVTLTNASSSSTSFAYTIGGGTATSGTDYGTPTFSNGVTLVGGNLIVPAGVTSFTITVPTADDVVSESSENYNVSVGGVSATGTITDNDGAPTISSVTSDTQTEGTALVHTVTLTNASSSSTSFAYTIGGGTATSGTDYGTPTFSNGVTLVGGNLIVPAGVTSFTITVPSTQDTIDEANETYNVSVGGVSAVGTITDDDAAPTISSVTSDTQTEGTALVHTVTLTNASSSSTSFAYTIGGGTATSGTDYGTPTFSNGVTLVGGNLIVPAGVTSFTITVPTTDDVVSESSENYNVSVGGVSATGTITDNDGAPTISSVTSDTQTEGTALVHTVTLTNASSSSTSFAYTIGGGTATSGTDYGTPTFSNGVTLVGGNLIVPAGVTSFTITVPSTQDTIDEANETYNVSVGGVSATGTITDDDAAPTISSVTSDTQTEGTALVHTVTLTNASSSSTSFAYTIGGGTATSGTDYGTPTFSNGVTLVGGNLIVPAGVTSFTITVPSTQDTIDEPNETYNVSVGGVSAVGTITDDDAAPTISSVTSDTQTEGTALVHTVTLTNASSSSTSFAYTIGGGTATSGTDYGTPTFSNGVTLVGGNLIVPAGVTSFTITVPSTQDTIDEANETYNVSVGGVSAVGTITDDDAAPTISSVTSDTQTEGTALVHTVTLTNASSSSTSFAYTIGGGTATSGTDYGTPTFSNGVTLVGGNLIVPAGVTSFTITVPSTQDTIDEANETYNVSVGGVSAVGTITDDDAAPTISSVTSDTQTEGTALVHTVTLTNASSSSTSFAYTIGGGTATSGTDYGTPTFSNGVTLVGGNLIVPAGVTSFTITVPSTQDTIDEANETYNVSVGGVSATGTITDDDAAPTISSVTSDTQTEGTSLVHTVTLTNASSSSTSFAYTIGGGTATSGTDYGTPTFSNGVTLVGGNLIVPAGVTSFTITVPSTQDTIDEPNETYNVSVGGVSAVGTITDDDAAPTISSVTSDTQTEGTALVHTVTLTNASSSSTSFAYTIGGGTATSGTDYGTPTFSNGVTLVGGNLIVPAGVTSFTITVPSTQDTIDEANETYNVSVGGVSAVGTITDDDAAPTISSVTSDTQTEGTALVHTVTLTNASSSSTSFAYTIGGGTATSGTDYGTPTFSNGVTLVGGNLIVPAGVTSFTITVPSTQDTIDEANETYNVSVGGVSATGAITDDDAAPTISSVTSDTQTEGTSLVHTVTLTNASSSSTSFAYTIGGGTATSGTDYGTPTFSNGVTLVGGNLIVPAGVTSFTITVPSTQDTIDEPNETYNVSVGGVSAVGTITDDDAAPTISSVTSDTQTEGTALVHTVTLTNASSSSTSFAYTIGGGTATSGTDYGTPTFSNGVTLVGGNLIVPAGVTSFTITVPSTQDTIDEANETYNVSVGGVSAVGTITDDDAAPTISSVTSDTQTEGTALVHTVTLTNTSSSSTSFAYTIGGGTATSGTDYGTPTFSNGVTLVGGNLIVPAGVTSFTITVPTTDDVVSESSENYNVSVGGVSATGTITDNDGAPSLSINDITVNEAAGTATFTVTLSAASGQTVSVGYNTSNGTATAGSDYTSTTGTLTFAPGVTTQTITVNIANDAPAIFEGAETFNVNLVTPTNATIADNLGVGTIRDDGTGTGGTDNDTPTLSVSSPTVAESAGFAQFTISLNNASTTATTVSLALANGTATGTGTDYGSGTATNLQVSTDGGLNWTNATTATIAAGATSVLVRTPITEDTLDEIDETFTLTATRTAGTTTNASAVGTATITDNDATPSLSINDITVNEAAGTATFTVTLSAASGQTVTVGYNTSNGTATAGSDYTSTTGTLTFAPGVTTQTITVNIANDAPAIFEGAETFNVNLVTPTNATIADNLGVGTIRDDGTGTGGTDNDTPTLSVSSPTVAESAGFAQFTISLNNASTTATTVSLALANGTATGTGTDYGSGTATNLQVSTDGGLNWTNATTATIAAGATSVLVRTPITEDTLDEIDETFTLTATRTAGTTTNASAVGTATITDNDATPSLSINDITVNEAAGTATFTVTLSAASGQTVTVGYNTSNGTATAGSDYTSTTGTLTFAPGVTTQTITVNIANDAPAIFEGAETFNVNLVTPTNATIADNLGVGTIRDDGTGTGGTDNDTPTLSVSSPTVAESAGFAQFTISLNNASTTATTVSLALANGTATGTGTDYGSGTATNLQVSTDGGLNWTNATTATIAAGATSVLVRTPITEDTLDEIDETFTLTATRTAGTTTNASAVGTATITDNDATPSLSINDITVNEAAGTATFTVTLSAASGQTVTVGYNTSNGTATAGSDYTSTTGTLTFAPGVTTQTITVNIANDAPAIFEGAETFNVNLVTPTNATIADNLGVGTIRDDGTGTGGTDNDTPTLSVSSPTVAESAGFAQFTISLNNASTTATTVSLALANGTATGTGTDYGSGTATNLQVSTDGGLNWTNATTATIAAGATSVLVRTPITEDTLDEIDETFTLTATRTAGTTTNASAVGTATITDNDATPSLSINDITVNEAAGTATFTVTLSAASGQTVTVGYNTSNGTATAGSDYTSTTGTLTFAPGVTTQTITVNIANDAPAIFEGAETFNVNLVTPTNATIADNLGVGTIRDDGTGTGGTDNDTPTLSVSSPTVAESAGFAQFTISLNNASTTATTVSLALANGTATGTGTDYGSGTATNLQVSTDGGLNWTNATTATIAAGATSVLVRTPITEDTLDEIDETFTLTATRTAGTTTNASAVGTATITDNDATPSLSINDITVNEAAGTATFTVTLSAASGQTVTVGYNTSNGTATAGSDYTSTTGTLTFAPGVTTQTITVNIANDAPAIFEGAETFNVNLVTPTNATIADNLGVGTIRDDGTGTGGTDNDTPTLSVSSPTVAESAGFAQFTISLNNASTTATTVSLALANGTATGTGTDYGSGTATNLQVSTDGGLNWTNATTATIAAGATSVLVRTPITEDTLDEIDETFTLTATRTAGTTTNASAVGTATITDNDATPSLSINDITVNEAAGTATFTVTLSAASGQTVTVGYNTSNGTATAGSDYTSTTGTLTFAPGVTTQTITVNIANDAPAIFEGAETFNVNLVTPTNATIADNLGVGTIRDDGTGTGGTDNDTPTLSVSSPTVAESAGFAQFTISLNNASTTATTVSLALANGTATGTGTDYGSGTATNLQVSTDGGLNWTNATTATIAAGATSVLVRTPIVEDTLIETSETFTLTATRTAGTTTNASALGTATITDNDFAPVAANGSVYINEDAASVITGAGSVIGGTYLFGWNDFGITDANAGDTLSVKIMSLPANGTLQFFNGASWVAVVAGTTTLTQAQIGSNSLRFVPAANQSGDSSFASAGVGNLKNDYATFTYQGVDAAGHTSSTATLTVDVKPVADTPTVSTTNFTKATLFTTSWEAADTGIAQTTLNPNTTSTAYTTTTTLSGWTRVDTPDNFAGGTNSFEIWSAGDTITGQNGTGYTIATGAPGGGTNWLELNNADAAGALIQTLGISRNVTTVAGHVYDLSLYYAGRNGFSTDFTRMTVYVDGVKVASYASSSPNDALNWENLHFSFVGTGASQQIRIVTDPIQYNSSGRGAMIDNITLTEMQGMLAGNAVSGTRTEIALSSYVSGALSDTDGSEVLSYTFTNLPAGANIITAAHPSGFTVVGGSVTVPGAELASAKLQLLSTYSGDLTLGVTAVATEPNASTASSTSANVTFTILSGMGADGYDYVYGNNVGLVATPNNANTLNGGANNDWMSGGAGNDTLVGNGGNDVLIGGQGSDSLTGSAGADTFKWSLNDNGTNAAQAIDTISDFATGTYASGGDRLDLRDLLSGESAATLDKFIHFSWNGTNTTAFISATGAFTAGHAVGGTFTDVTNNSVQQIVFAGVNLTSGFTTDLQVINDLISKGKLVTD